jgi:hypothetical protein
MEGGLWGLTGFEDPGGARAVGGGYGMFEISFFPEFFPGGERGIVGRVLSC